MKQSNTKPNKGKFIAVWNHDRGCGSFKAFKNNELKVWSHMLQCYVHCEFNFPEGTVFFTKE